MKSPTIYLIYDYRINKERCKKYSLYLLYFALDFNLLKYIENNLDALDYGTPRNIEKGAVDHNTINVVVKKDKIGLGKALTIKYQE